ncbi:hypothetical protein QFW77_04715 [Luteimonas sp. RD2P54]|uniref:Uncharacterized protein n=1 Tax=Luteimonas endophytica TaxID=3042023 RepID=A0ABT6J6U9_9GAMM|nr:hypothetical protein [Luteimonas endophytica]MDH5822292.1 hypothetical protein [Luteimonas endophytica]
MKYRRPPPFYVQILAIAVMASGSASAFAAQLLAPVGEEAYRNALMNRRIFSFLDSIGGAADINRQNFERHVGLRPASESALEGNILLRYAYGTDGAWGYLFTLKDSARSSVDIGIAPTIDFYDAPIDRCALDFETLDSRLRGNSFDAANSTVHALGGQRMTYQKGDLVIRVTYIRERAAGLSCIMVIEIQSVETGND